MEKIEQNVNMGVVKQADGDSLPLKRQRQSGIELFRIISMLLIVAHHYVVNSGVLDVISLNPTSVNSIFLYIFGGWGKIGINCFVLITGYFMCTSKISAKKFLKLLFEIELYKIIIYLIFVLTGYEQISLTGIVKAILPITAVAQNFTGCFLIFFLLIPFLNMLIKSMSKRQHAFLLVVLLTVYSLIATLPKFYVVMNYVSWFIVLYFVASFIRLYPIKLYEKTLFWGIATAICFILCALSVAVMAWLSTKYDFAKDKIYYFVSDSNKLSALIMAICAFMFFKNLKFQSKFINGVASTMFGVLLIHANSDTMRKWLWGDVIKAAQSVLGENAILHAIISVVVIFVVCIIIDYLRILLIEKPIFKALGDKLDKVDEFIVYGKNKQPTVDTEEK